MARPLRIDVENGVYHMVTRGIDRNSIFRSEGNRNHWLDLMAEAQARFRLRLFAYVLMDNHVHLVLQTPFLMRTTSNASVQPRISVKTYYRGGKTKSGRPSFSQPFRFSIFNYGIRPHLEIQLN